MIVCFGATPTVQRSMVFERVRIGEVNRAARVSEYASGKSPNVARVLKTLGESPLAVGFAGGDRGKFLLQDLESAQISCDFVTIAPQTRLCATIIDESAATELVEEHAPVPPEGWEEMSHKLHVVLPESKTWIFSGSLPPGAPQNYYARWTKLARQQRANLIIDARGEPMRLALKGSGAFIAKLNREELAQTLNAPIDSDADLASATRKITPRDGASIVTLGPDGAIACDGQSLWRVTSPSVVAISAIGSGDAFTAGVALGLTRGQTLPQALKLGAACGAANAMTALAGHLSAEDVDRLVTEAQVVELP